ncbi:hypothetical protein [Nostoc parmelioides]|uniref:Uncharacterized protein n=1 Tax=Nostoc parmelioides FACHB-3921 TaxID=2692909 RepID=A0ABR8BLB2_9NOSO|nr:hypothetical protein [Nostoc parmelioides]MBD2254706.1 hypothetical protein [Nostoc parmelioides FACHB-3921]
MKKIPRAPVRAEDEPGYEKEIWQPSWQCFCCHDSGIVQPHLAQLVIDGYNYDQDKFPRCQNPGCKAGSHWDNENVSNSVDYRLSPVICKKIDSIEREGWRQTTHQKCANLKTLSQNLAMPGSQERTEQDNREVQQRKAEIEAISHEQWMAMRKGYLGEESA